MAKTTCDGDIYIHNLSTFIQSHERQLANALVAYRKLNSKDSLKSSKSLDDKEYPTSPPLSSDSKQSDKSDVPNDTTINDEDNFKEISKPVRLSLSLHHLYFILGKFKELGINVGPMNLRLDPIDSENTSNYVSFLSEFQRNKKIDSDSQSIHSISSVKSVMSSVSALWNTFGSSSKVDNSISDLKYLYSAFSKLPCLRLANEPKAKLIDGHEEYPFETATPIIVFKNILVLEISDLDPKEVYGWHLLANKLRYLVVKKANITDPIELLVNLVDADQRVRGEGDIYDVQDEDIYDDDHINNNKLSKFKSNDSEPDTFKTPHSLSNMPMSHSSLNLSSSLTNKVSPTIHQSHSFAASYNSHSLSNYHSFSYPHNYNYHHHHYHQQNNNSNQQLNTDTFYQFSTSPTASSYHSNRLYPPDEVAYTNSTQSGLPSSVHSTRRSYFYKNKAPRRSRGSSQAHSSSVAIKATGGESINSNESQNHNKVFKKNEDHSRNNSIDDNDKDAIDLKKQADYWKLLKHLSLTENKINTISFNSFDRLTNLTSLDLSYNKLKTLPSEPLSKLVNLKTLNLSHNRLISVEKFPKTLTKLTVLSLRSNKIKQIETIENLSNLLKIDLRQNSILKVTDLKPLLLLNENKVTLQSINIYGNPVTSTKGYRIELFNLFNGVEYNNNIKIDGSRPGIFESRMLLDEKTSRMKFKNFIDESIISRMTASVSSMNLGHILNNPTNSGFNALVQNSNTESSNHDSLETNHPVLDQMSTSINRSNISSTTLNSTATTVTQLNNKSVHNSMSSTVGISTNASKNVSTSFSNTQNNNSETSSLKKISQSPTVRGSVNGVATRSNSIPSTSTDKKKSVDFLLTDTEDPMEPPVMLLQTACCAVSTSPSLSSVRNLVAISLRNSTDTTPAEFTLPLNKPGQPFQRTSNDFSSTGPILTTQTTSSGPNGNDTNPLSRLSLASPALPVITQATTTTMTITNVSTPNESGNSNVDLTPISVSSRVDYFTAHKNDREENKENHEDDYSTGLKIGVV